MHNGEIVGEQKQNAKEPANYGQRRSRANGMANYWISAAIAFWCLASSIVSFFVFVGTPENAKESVMDGVNGTCAGVRSVIGALANTLLDNVQGLGLVSILILALLFSNYAPQGQAFEMSANRSMTRAPAIYREKCDTNWAARRRRQRMGHHEQICQLGRLRRVFLSRPATNDRPDNCAQKTTSGTCNMPCRQTQA